MSNYGWRTVRVSPFAQVKDLNVICSLPCSLAEGKGPEDAMD